MKNFISQWVLGLVVVCVLMPNVSLAQVTQPEHKTTQVETKKKAKPASKTAAKKAKAKKRKAKLATEPIIPEPEVVEEPRPEPPPTLEPSTTELKRGLLGLPPLNRDPVKLILIFFLLLIVFAILWVMQRTKFLSARNPTLQRYASLSYGTLRFVAILLGLYFSVHVLPVNSDVAWTVILAAAVALGFSMRHLLADVIAGFVLLFERRIKKGMWVSGESFQGSVERRGLRATWLRDGQGHQLAVPNRVMIGDPIVYDTGGDTEHEVTLKLAGFSHAPNIRQCLHDSVLSSPWVLAGATPIVLRDPSDPDVWRVRSKLLEPRFAVKFEGELLERVEDLLRYDLAVDIETETPEEVEATRPTKPNGDEKTKPTQSD